MIKMLWWLAVVVSAIGIYLGAIQVTFHIEKLGNISSLLQGVSTWQDALAKGQYYVITWKRTAELYFASSSDAKLKLDVTYLTADTASLKTALDATASDSVIITKAQLLSDSLKRLKAQTSDASEKVLKETQAEVVKAIAGAEEQLARLQALSKKYEQYKEKINELSETPTASKIPLKF